MITRVSHWLSTLLFVALVPLPAFAQGPAPAPPPPGGAAAGPAAPVDPLSSGILPANLPGCDFVTGSFEPKCIPIYIGYLVKWVVGLVGVLFILNTMIAGYQITIGYATGSGIEKGLGRLKSSILGFVVTTLVFVIFDTAIRVIGG